MEQTYCLKKASERSKSGATLYLCQCDCGNTCKVNGTKLTSGHTKSCGCLIKDTAAKKFERFIGKKYGQLTIIKDSGKRTSRGQRIVLCQCDCGNFAEVIFSKLSSGHTKTCGCKEVERIKNLSKLITNEDRVKAVDTLKKHHILIEKTKINMIKPDKKILTSNKSGVTGVCYDKNRKKWVSQITFQGKNINLGRFIRFEDAVKARKNAEEIYFKPILKKYENRGGRKNEK